MKFSQKPRSRPSAELDRPAHEVIGAAIEVHRVPGSGLLESVYEEALCVELAERGLDYARQPAIDLHYKGHVVGRGRLDLLVGNALVVELKSVETLNPAHAAQVISYLKTAGYKLGLLINFNVPCLRDGLKRIVSSQPLGFLALLASWRFREASNVKRVPRTA